MDLVSSSVSKISSVNALGGMHKVLVLDANQRSALAVIRSLGRHGLKVIAADHRPYPLGAASKYAITSVRYPDPALFPGAFVTEIIALAERLGIDLIVPATDLTTMLLASQSGLFKTARLATPQADSYETLTDKARLIELAGKLALPVPETHIAHTRPAIVDAAHDLGFPVVLKPARSQYLKAGRIFSTGVEIVRRAEDLSETLSCQNWLDDIPCLVQQFVPGHGAGIFALYGRHGSTAWFAHRRIREKPPAGGVSVLSESVPVDPTMQSAATKLLDAVHWTGVAMIEFRVAEDGTPYLMEVNGRFWGSLQLAIDCGVDFPWLLYRLAHNLPTAPLASYVAGRRLRWLLGDLDSLLIEMATPSSTFTHKARSIVTFTKSFADMHCQQEILRLHDPRPAMVEVRQWLGALRK